MMEPGRVVIVGSGLSGLATAVLLAEAGWTVTVLESHAIPGGLMQRYRRGGRWFDTGFHLLTDAGPEGIVRKILLRLGILDEVHFLAPDPAAQFTLRIPGRKELALPMGMEATQHALSLEWPNQAAALGNFFYAMRRQLAASSWLDHLALGAPAAESRYSGLSVNDQLRLNGVTGDAATILGAASSILAMRAEQCPFELYASFAGASFAGSWRIAHGGDGLTRPLVARLATLGGRLLLRNPAVRIEHTGLHCSAVVDGTGVSHPADLVITTCHPDAVISLTGESGFRGNFLARVKEVPDSAGALLMAVELSEPATRLGRSHHLFRLANGDDGYLVAPDAWGESQPPSLEAMVWIDPATVAAWRDSVLGRRPAEYSQWKTAQQVRLQQAIDEQFPWLTPTIRRIWMASPLTFRDYLGGRHGGAMGLSQNLGHLGDSPLQSRNRLRNLFMIGQSITHPGIQGCLVGACILAGGILQRDVRQELSA